jgi:hypothetical protein
MSRQLRLQVAGGKVAGWVQGCFTMSFTPQIDGPKPYEFIEFGVIDVIKPCGSTLCYTVVFPGRNSGFRAGFRPDSSGKASKSSLRLAFGRPEARFEVV